MKDRINVENRIKARPPFAASSAHPAALFIGTHEDPRRLEIMAAAFNQPVESLKCDGCRAERRNFYCSSCKLILCASEKGLDFCGQCSEYPCEELKAFQSILPHRLELWQSLARIKEVGWEHWYGEMFDHYSCPQCGTHKLGV